MGRSFPPLSEAQFSNYSNKDSIDIVGWQQNNVDFTVNSLEKYEKKINFKLFLKELLYQ